MVSVALSQVGTLFLYPLSLLASIWLLGALFAYTLKATLYSARAPFTVDYVDPGLAYFKKKALVIGVDFAYVAFVKFRAKMGNDSNIEYHDHHCVVQVRDRGRHYKLYLPFHKNIMREGRYRITAETEQSPEAAGGKKEIDYLHTVPGVPILVSPSEMGKDVIKCSKPNGEIVWVYRNTQRPVCNMILQPADKKIV